MRPGWVEVVEPVGRPVIVPPAVFFPLLFGAVAPEGVGPPLPEEAQYILAGLFPCEAPVYWRTDVV